MANETLSIRKDQARLTVIGKSKADTYIDSGLGLDLGDLPSLDLDPFDLNWQIDVPDPENLPDEIRIITMPKKLEYVDGEKIDISGAVVGAYKNDSIWTSAKYPNGHIPLGELIVDPLIAEVKENIIKVSIEGIDLYASVNKLPDIAQSYIFIGGTGTVDTYAIQAAPNAKAVLLGIDKAYWKPYTGNPDPSDLYYYPGGYTALTRYMVTDQPSYLYGTASLHGSYEAVDAANSDEYRQSVLNSANIVTSTRSITQYMKTAYIGGGSVGIPSGAKPSQGTQAVGWVYDELVELAAWEALYGEGTDNAITLSWMRPVDWNVLSTSFNIDVTDSGKGGGGR